MTDPFDAVREREERLTTMRREIEDFRATETALSTQLTEALAAGKDAQLVRSRRNAVRSEREDLEEAAALLTSCLKAEREAAGAAAGKARLLGIKKAHGSLRDEYANDIQRLQEQAAAYHETAERAAARFRALRTLRAEASALSDRFALAAPELPNVVPPFQHPGAAAAWAQVQAGAFGEEHSRTSPHLERNEFETARRDYREVRGTPAYEIIEQAGGPRPFAPVDPKRVEAVRERLEYEAEQMGRFDAEAPKAAARG